jgi:hypothetical protein
MKARDFVYNFTDILFTELVKGTILTENWEEADFDYRYAEYPDIFLKMKDCALDTANTDDDVLKMLKNSKNTVVRNFNKTMRDNFIEEFRRHGANDAIFDELLSSDILKDDMISMDSLLLFLRFEERTFTQKPKKGVLI